MAIEHCPGNVRSPKIHAVLGRIGAGKTAYSRKLAAEHKALFFSIDQWIAGIDRAGGYEVYKKLYPICEQRIREVARQAFGLGLSVVLDFGANRARGRKGLLAFAQTAGVDVQFYHLIVPEEICRARMHERNRTQPEGIFSYVFNDEEFDDVAKQYEPPAADENIQVIDIINN